MNKPGVPPLKLPLLIASPHESNHDALCRSIREKNESLFDTLLPDVDLQNEFTDGNSPLSLSIKTQQESMALKLIHHGHPLDVNGRNGDSAFICAATAGLKNVVLEILQRGQDINVCCSGFCAPFLINALLMSMWHGHLDVAFELIRKGIDMNEDYLREATRVSPQIAIELIENGCELSCDVLSCAIEKGRTEIIEKVIECGLEIHGTDSPQVHEEYSLHMDKLKSQAQLTFDFFKSYECIYPDFAKEFMPVLFRNDVIPSFKRKANDDPNPVDAKKQKCS